MLLETDPSIDAFGSCQDIAWIKCGREESFVRLWFQRDQSKSLIVIKPANVLKNPKLEPWINAIRILAAKNNYGLETWTEKEIRIGYRVENARRIFYEATPALDPDPDRHDALVAQSVVFSQQPISIERLLTELGFDPDRLDIAFCLINVCRLQLENPNGRISTECIVRRHS